MHHQYIETRGKFIKFSAKLQKSQDRGEFQKLSSRKQHFLLSRVRKLWERLRLLEVQLKIASVGISLALLFMVNNASAQQFVAAPERNPMPPPTIYGDRIELLDIDGDGDLDILTKFYNNRIHYYKNIGTAISPDFEKVPDSESPFHELNYYGGYEIRDAADVDNDGDIDLFLEDGHILRNTGSNELIVYDEQRIDGIDRYNYHLGDIDADGDLDVIYFDKENGVIINENIGDAGNFTISGSETVLPVTNWNDAVNSISDMAIADLDQDGDLDADGDFDLIMESDIYLFSFYEYKENVLEENRDLIPDFYDGILLPYSYLPPQFVDYDGDGDLDIFAGTDSECVYYEQVSSSGQCKFQKREDVKLPFVEDSREFFVSFGDIDRDGDADGDMDLFMIGSGRTDGEWHMGTKYFENSGNDPFVFTERRGFGANPLIGINEVYFNDVEYSVLDFADIDIDGDYDVVFSGYYGKIYFVENVGTAAEARFVDHTNESPFWGLSAGYYGFVSVVDIDGDGDEDIFTHSYYGMITSYYENTPGLHTGVQEFSDNGQLQLFPNPVQNELNVELPGNVEGLLHYQILSIEGRSVQNGELQNHGSLNRYTINAESLHSGCYLLKIKSKNQNYISKFIKQ